MSSQTLVRPEQETIVPGGKRTKYPCDVAFLVDVSSSTKGKPNEAMNFAVKEAIALLKKTEGEQPVEFFVRVYSYGTEAKRVDADWTPVSEYAYQPLSAKGTTAMGGGLGLLLDDLVTRQVPNAMPSIFFNLTDGAASDEGEYVANLESLLKQPAFVQAVRIPVSLGTNPRLDLLEKFASPHIEEVFNAQTIDLFVQYIVYATGMASRMVSQPAGASMQNPSIAMPSLLAGCDDNAVLFGE